MQFVLCAVYRICVIYEHFFLLSDLPFSIAHITKRVFIRSLRVCTATYIIQKVTAPLIRDSFYQTINFNFQIFSSCCCCYSETLTFSINHRRTFSFLKHLLFLGFRTNASETSHTFVMCSGDTVRRLVVHNRTSVIFNAFETHYHAFDSVWMAVSPLLVVVPHVRSVQTTNSKIDRVKLNFSTSLIGSSDFFNVRLNLMFGCQQMIHIDLNGRISSIIRVKSNYLDNFNVL